MPVATLLTLSSKKILSFRLIPELGVFLDASVEQFAYDNKEEKEAILGGGVLKTRQTVLFSLHFLKSSRSQSKSTLFRSGIGRSPLALPRLFRYFPPAVAKVYIVSFRTHDDRGPSKFIVLGESMRAAIKMAWEHGGADFPITL
jgi:hypothetical protein